MVGQGFLVRDGNVEFLPEVSKCWAGEEVSGGEGRISMTVIA